jgi:hypothetical protein
MELASSLASLQNPSIGPYLKPAESSPQTPTVLPYDRYTLFFSKLSIKFWIHLLYFPQLPQVTLTLIHLNWTPDLYSVEYKFWNFS